MSQPTPTTSSTAAASSSLSQYIAAALPLDDPRMGDWIRKVDLSQLTKVADVDASRTRVVFTGFPFDEGCKRNGGRPGAALGPHCVRTFVPRMGTVINPEYGLDLRTIDMFDVGDVATEAEQTDGSKKPITLEEAHTELRQRVHKILASHPNTIPFVVGGSNDQSYPNAAGLMDFLKTGDIGVMNLDAHLDVRPLKNGQVHSGSPFRLLLEDERFAAAITSGATSVPPNVQPSARFVEFAAQGNQCSQTHADYVTGKGQAIHWLSQLRSDATLTIPAQFESIINKMASSSLFISFDLDCVSGADAPGVSCPGTIGLTAEEAIQIAMAAGANPRVKLFDLSEFNPDIDSYRTGRLVANMFYFFCLGVARRVTGNTNPLFASNGNIKFIDTSSKFGHGRFQTKAEKDALSGPTKHQQTFEIYPSQHTTPSLVHQRHSSLESASI